MTVETVEAFDPEVCANPTTGEVPAVESQKSGQDPVILNLGPFPITLWTSIGIYGRIELCNS